MNRRTLFELSICGVASCFLAPLKAKQKVQFSDQNDVDFIGHIAEFWIRDDFTGKKVYVIGGEHK